MPITASGTPLDATSVTSITLTVSTNAPTNPNVYSHELPVDDITMGKNKHLIPHTSDVHKGFHEHDAGTPFIASVNAYHGGGLSTVKSTSSSLFTPDPISTQVALTPIVAKYGDTPISLTDYVTTNSKGVVTYIIGDTSIANVSPDGNKLNILKAGSTTIYAKQAASGLYLSAVSNTVSLIINPIAPTYTFDNKTITNGGQFTMSSQNVRASPFTITPTPTYPTSSSTGAYSYTSNNTTVATVDAKGIITVKTVGTTTITVSQAAAGNYISGNVQASLVVNAIAPTFTFGGDVIPTGGKFIITSPTPGATTFRPIYPTSSSKGAYSYASSNTDIATVSTTGDITIKAVGTVNIIVTQAAEGNYTSRSVNGSLRVMYKWIMQGQDINGEISNDQSGTSVSLSEDGTIVAVGAPYNNGNGSDSGHVRVYKLIANTWTRQGGDIDGEDSDDESGTSVSLSKDGTIVAIGAPNNDAGGSNAGNVRVFKYNANKTKANSLGPAGWDQQGGDINGEAANDKSGTSVSISDNGTIVAIGAPNNDAGGSNAGQVRVFKYNANKTKANSLGPAGWDQQGGDINGEAANDESGTSVSLSGDGTIVAIGAPKSNGGGSDSGSVRVFKYNGTTNKWTRQGGDIDGESANDESGTSVSLSKDGTIVAIGAPKSNNGNVSDSGQVRVFKYNANKTTANSLGPAGWDQQGGDINGENANDESGSSVSLSGDGLIVAIGGPKNNGSGSDSGHVRVYKLIGGAWIKQDGDIDGEASTDESGRSVSISRDGLIVAIGAPNNNSNESGHVRVYKYILSA
jgi:hypothetical protein